MACTDRFCIEVSIDDRSDAALEATKAFRLNLRKR